MLLGNYLRLWGDLVLKRKRASPHFPHWVFRVILKQPQGSRSSRIPPKSVFLAWPRTNLCWESSTKAQMAEMHGVFLSWRDPSSLWSCGKKNFRTLLNTMSNCLPQSSQLLWESQVAQKSKEMAIPGAHIAAPPTKVCDQTLEAFKWKMTSWVMSCPCPSETWQEPWGLPVLTYHLGSRQGASLPRTPCL